MCCSIKTRRVGGPQSSEDSGETHTGNRHRETGMLRGGGGGAGCAQMLVWRWTDSEEGTRMVLRWTGKGKARKPPSSYSLSRLSVDPGRECLEDTSLLFKNYTNDTRFKLYIQAQRARGGGGHVF